MPITRGQMKRQLRMGGGIMNAIPRQAYGIGDIAKAVTRPLKKAAKTVGKIVKSDLGKAALLAAAGAYAGGLGPFAKGSTMFGGKLAGIKGAGFAQGLFPSIMDYSTPTRSFFTEVGKLGSKALGKVAGDGITGILGKGAALAGLSAFLTSQYGLTPEQQEEELADPEKLQSYLRIYYTNLNPNAGSEEIEEFVRQNSADGGRIGFANGPVLPPDPTQPVNPFGPKPGDFGIEEDIPIKMASNIENDKILEALFEKYLDMGMSPKEASEAAYAEFEKMSKKEEKFFSVPDRSLAALGGKMDTPSDNAVQAAGIEGLPVRKNPAGVTELDLRKTGGFIQPVGIKEKEDDIPAMLSNNEFVFTADAVRGAGDGNVNLGAQRMYDTMKRLEAGGKA
jgi:hypothetical protein